MNTPAYHDQELTADVMGTPVPINRKMNRIFDRARRGIDRMTNVLNTADNRLANSVARIQELLVRAGQQ